MLKRLLRDFKPFIKYSLVGVSGTLIDLIVLYLLVENLGLPVLHASFFSFMAAVTNNFVLNKVWTFNNSSQNYRKLYIKFALVSTGGLCLTLACMHIFVEVLGIWYILAKMLTSLLVLTWNFLGNKIWTFRISESHLWSKANCEYELSIIVPAYNEENRIKPTLLSIFDYLEDQNLHTEVIVVNDGSSDKTSEVITKMQKKFNNLKLVELEKNQGKGCAVKSGVIASKGHLILFTDADNSTPIEELSKLLQAMSANNAEIAIGSRYLKKSKVHVRQPWYRVALGRLGNVLIRLFLIDGIRDTQCGFKLFKAEVAHEIFALQKIRRFAFDMEALIIADSLGYKITEVPVNWFNSSESRLRPILDSLRTLRDLVLIKLNLWSGRYRVD